MAIFSQLLEAIASQFRSLGIPAPVVVGYTGGVLSVVMQKQPILESPHFWTGSIVLILLAANSFISLTGFGSNKPVMRTVHTFLGSGALCLLFLQAVLGLKLGLAI